jgi:hypothetical protein
MTPPYFIGDFSINEDNVLNALYYVRDDGENEGGFWSSAPEEAMIFDDKESADLLVLQNEMEAQVFFAPESDF